MTQPPDQFDFARIRWIYFGLMIGMFTSSISQTIVSPAIPRIIADLGGVEYYSWLSTIVMLVSAIVTPISGKLADMFGRRRFYVLGLVLFMIGSALSGLATSFTFLVAARAVQGVAMGILMPLSQTILGDVIPPRQRGKYAGYMGALMGASQVAGPLIGGAITDAASWRWLFYVNLPVGLVALFLVIRFMKVPEIDIPRTVDHAGIAAMTVGVTSALLGISLGGTRGWADPLVLGLLAVGAVVLVLFVFIERRAAEPIVPMYLFRNSIFTWSVIASCFMNMALITLIIYTPVYAQGVLGVSATESGLILIPMNVGLFLMGIVIGQLTTRTGRYKSFAVVGVTLMAIASVLMLRLGAHSTPWELTLWTTLFGLGTGMSFQIYTLVVQNAVKRRDLGPATSSLQFFRSVANTLGTAVAGTLMTTQLVNGLRTNMTPEAQAQIPAGGLDPNVVLDPNALVGMPEAVVAVLRESLAGAMHSVYLVLPGLAVVVLLATVAIRAIPLRDTLGPTEPGQALEAASRSNIDPGVLVLTPEERHDRAKERMMAAHLSLLAAQVERGDNPILCAAVQEFGEGDLGRGLHLLRATSAMLLAEDPDTIDAHEAFAVELSERGKRRAMLSDELTGRLHAVAEQVARRAMAQDEVEHVTRPRSASVEGIDTSALQRAVWLLDTALVADIAVRRELDFVPELPIPQTPADDEPDAEASGREEPGQKPEEGSGR